MVSWLALAATAAALSLGCGDSGSGSDDTNGQPEATFDDQVVAGKTLFMRNCAHCHGSSGEGGDAPRLVNLSGGALPLEPPEGALLRTGQFRTAADVADFASAYMPIEAPGLLTSEEYYAIVAFLLDENGVASDAVLDAESAATIEIPR